MPATLIDELSSIPAAWAGIRPTGADCLTSLEPLETNPHPLWSQTTCQRAIHHTVWAERLRVLEAMMSHKGNSLGGRAARIESCCCSPMFCMGSDGKPKVSLGLCRDRLCPTCQRYRGKAMAARLTACIRTMDAPRFITLTLKHEPGPLSEGIRRLAEAFRLVRKGKRWRSRVIGGVYTIEITRNADTGDWHPHLHAVVDGSFYKQSDLSADWSAASGGSTIVHIQSVPSRASVAAYISKYVSKPAQMPSWTNETICEYALALAGKRMVHTWGSCHNVKVDDQDLGGAKVTIEPLITAGKLNWLGVQGCKHARYAIEVLSRAGGLLARCVGIRRDSSVPSLPPVTEWEYERLAVCLRHCSGDWSSGLADLDDEYSATRPPEPPVLQGILDETWLIHDHPYW